MPSVPPRIVPSTGVTNINNAYYLMNSWVGPVSIGGNLYAVGGFGGTNIIEILKSTDNGFTWTVITSATTPPWGWVTFDVNTSTFHIAAQGGGGGFYAFDCLTETWVASPYSPAYVSSASKIFIPITSTDYILLLLSFGSITYTFNGAAEVTLFSGFTTYQATYTIANGVAHVFVLETSFSTGADTLYHLTIDSTGIASSPTTITTFAASINPVLAEAVYRTNTDEVVVALEVGAVGTSEVGYYSGTPSSSPVFGSFQTVFSGLVNGTFVAHFHIAWDQSQTYDELLFIITAGSHPSSPFSTEVYVIEDDGAGGWLAPRLLWDSLAVPPILPTGWTWEGIAEFGVSYLPNGDIAFFVGGESFDDGSGGNPCNYMIYGSEALVVVVLANRYHNVN